MAYAYPIQLDVTDRLIVIIGGGAVAARKAVGLAAAGATRVRCVSPAFDAQMPTSVQRVQAEYEPARLDGATLVFAATNSTTVNDAVVRDARARHILVSRADREADDATAGDFTLPATHRAGPISITVAAGGNPTLAAALRDQVAQQLDPGWVALAEAMSALRPRVLASAAAASIRRDLFQSLASPEAMAIVKRDGFEALVRWLNQRYPDVRL